MISQAIRFVLANLPLLLFVATDLPAIAAAMPEFFNGVEA